MRRVLGLIEGADAPVVWSWLESLPDVQADRCDPGTPLGTSDTDVLWIHGDAAPPADLKSWLHRGGRLLATLDAARIPFDLGIETTAPNDVRADTWFHSADEFWLPEYRSFLAFPHIRGFGAFGPHPLFAGLDQGTYTWAPTDGESFRWVTYRGIRPAIGAVVAVERSFIHLNAARVVAWEYPVGDGGILCVGAFVHPASADLLLQRQLLAMLHNAIVGDAIPHRDREIPVATWPEQGHRCRHDITVPVPRIEGVDDAWSPSQSPLVLGGPSTSSDPWTLAGRRMLLVGKENTGLSEVWSHPFRVMLNVRLEVDGQPALAQSIIVQPDQITRTIGIGTGRLEERWTTSLERPVMIGEIVGERSVAIRLHWRVDLRRMWPYPAACCGDLRWNVSERADSLWIGATGSATQILFQLVGGRFETSPSATEAALDVVASGTGALRLIAVAGIDSGDLSNTRRALEKKRLEGVQRQRSQHTEHLLTRGTGIEVPDLTLPTAFEWAKARVDSFLAETPGVGRSLLAGYAESRPGWADGRPGYAWYFGRDACWTSFAQLAAGDREAPADVIRFLARTQDVSGKILHEYTTSGLVHYDAADSTPLFLLLIGRYAAWTGDLDLVIRHWDAIVRAYRFCLETDSDGDGLIENTRVGHGWIEHGPLGGAHVTLYLASCWIAALEQLEPVAEALGRTDLADEMRTHCARARVAVDQRLRLNGVYALGLKADGTAMMHRTAMLAVPLLLGVVHGADASGWFDAISGPTFTTPWGVRMIASDDPLFEPGGYHRGAVWPLYTGWVSLAEWRAGRFEAALEHLMINASLIYQRARGAFDEVLHGIEYRDAGICPDQAWSAAMVISPAIEGLWGVTPDALNDQVTVAPWFPPQWNRMTLRRLRVGRTVMDVTIRRRAGQIQVRVTRTFGPGVHLRFVPRGMAPPVGILVDDIEMGSAAVQFQVSTEHEIIYSF
ncbi:MAG: GH116 family glycosyl hydrolase [Gemmatimonadota bacterium]